MKDSDPEDIVLVADDPVLQYLREHKDVNSDDIVVAEENVPLCSIYSVIN